MVEGPILSGILLGLMLAMLIGPVFFMVINTSIKQGFIQAAMFAVGVLISDIIFATITYYGSALIFYLKKYDHVIGLIGG